MSELFYDLEFVRCFIDDLLIITKGSLENHLHKLRTVLKRLRAAGLKINATKSLFAGSKLEYLGYWISHNGISRVPTKIQAILALKPPTTKKELRCFLGLINNYRNMWARYSETLAPLMQHFHRKLHHGSGRPNTSKLSTIIGKSTLLTHPDVTLPPTQATFK